MFNFNKCSIVYFLFKLGFVIGSVVFFLLLVYLFKVYKARTFDWRLSSDIHTLFLGASQPERAVDPSSWPNSINLSAPSECYMFTFLKLKKILECNEQIDTVFLQFAPLDVRENADEPYFSINAMKRFIPIYSPFFSLEEMKVYCSYSSIKSVLFAHVSKIYLGIPTGIRTYGHFTAINDKKFDRNHRYRNPLLNLNNGGEGNKINLLYLNKIVDLCLKYKCKLYFVYYPVFAPEEYYDQSFFRKVYKEQFNTIELLDFNDFNIPDSLRADEHHLNAEGAIYFTNYFYKKMHPKERN